MADHTLLLDPPTETVVDIRDGAPTTGSTTGPAPLERLRTSMCIAVAAIALLNLADLITTRIALSMSGAQEGNPLSALLINNGMIGMAKIGIVLALIFRVPRLKPTIALHAVLWFVAGIYALTVLSNLLAIQRLG